MTINFMESGSDATGDLSFYASAGGTVTSDNTVSHTGPRSIKMTMNSFTVASGVLNDVGRRISVWVRFSTLPASYIVPIQIQQAALAGVCYNLYILANGTLNSNPTGATAAVGTAVLAANTWYRICVAYKITSTTVFTFKVYVNGVLDSTANAGTMSVISTSELLLCALSDGAVNVWEDDIYVDDVANFSDPGDVRVTAKKPAANNVNNFDTAVGANPANRWTNVNEVPLSITNGWEQLALANTQENYTLEAAAVGDVDITNKQLVGRSAWLWAKETVAGLGTPQIMDNGTETAITLTTVGALYTVITISIAYPSNAAGIGMRSANAAAGTFLYECGTLIAYMGSIPIDEGSIWYDVVEVM